MRELRTSGSVGALAGQPPRSTRPITHSLTCRREPSSSTVPARPFAYVKASQTLFLPFSFPPFASAMLHCKTWPFPMLSLSYAFLCSGPFLCFATEDVGPEKGPASDGRAGGHRVLAQQTLGYKDKLRVFRGNETLTEKGPSNEGPFLIQPLAASTLQMPLPFAEMYRNTKQ